MSEKLMNVGDVSRMFDIPKSQICYWIRNGFIRASGGRRRGYGADFKLDRMGMLGVGSLSSLRRKKVSLSLLRPTSRYLLSVSIADLESAFYRGKTLLVSQGDSPPCLVHPNSIAVNRGADTLLLVIDLEAAYRMLIAAIESKQAASKNEKLEV